ncbi:MAG: FAD-binding protein, partial [Nitrospinota bacterium]
AYEVPERFWDLVKLGVPFAQKTDGRFRQRHSDFATYRRTMAVPDGSTGRAIAEALARELQRREIPVDQGVMLVDLLSTAGHLSGALGCDRQGNLIRYEAGAVVLATGGVSALYPYQVSTDEMTGDGLAAAIRAGAEIVNVEFHQMGPSILFPLRTGLSAPLYRLKPRFLNGAGQEFLARYLPEGISEEEVFGHKVYPFTISNVSRYLDIAIFSEIQAGRGTGRGTVLCDFTSAADQFRAGRCRHTYTRLKAAGVDLAREPVEVAIAFQCINGGVRMASEHAETTLPGLYAAGEVAGGIRGPDRPGGNSLGECQVFGHRAGVQAALRARERGSLPPDPASRQVLEERLARFSPSQGTQHPSPLMSRLRQVMGQHALVVRHATGLDQALAEIEEIRETLEKSARIDREALFSALELDNALLCARAILEACLRREESRSGHYRTDFPHPDDRHWRKSLVASLQDG